LKRKPNFYDQISAGGLFHQTAYASVTNMQADLLQLLRHAGPTVTAKAKMMLLSNMGQYNTMSSR
jgi:hypothetical protein